MHKGITKLSALMLVIAIGLVVVHFIRENSEGVIEPSITPAGGPGTQLDAGNAKPFTRDITSNHFPPMEHQTNTRTSKQEPPVVAKDNPELPNQRVVDPARTYYSVEDEVFANGMMSACEKCLDMGLLAQSINVEVCGNERSLRDTIKSSAIYAFILVGDRFGVDINMWVEELKGNADCSDELSWMKRAIDGIEARSAWTDPASINGSATPPRG